MEKQLLDSPFWNKKLDVSSRVQYNGGVVTRNDFEGAIKRFSEVEGMSKERVDTYRRHIEALCENMGLTDASATLSCDIMKMATAKMADDPQKGAFFTVLFDLLDVNQDGVISFKEWQTYYECIGANTAFAKASFEAMDTNHDGVVSRDEFMAYNYEFFFSTDNSLNSAILFGPLD